jgi:hypothetical protein
MFKSIFSKYQIDSILNLVNGNKNYYIYNALVTQSGVNTAPTVTIRENTLGAIVWTAGVGAPGVYYGTLTGAFPASKLFLPIPVKGFDVIQPSGTELGYYTLYRASDNQIVLQSRNISDVSANGILLNSPIEIKVYK